MSVSANVVTPFEAALSADPPSDSEDRKPLETSCWKPTYIYVRDREELLDVLAANVSPIVILRGGRRVADLESTAQLVGGKIEESEAFGRVREIAIRDNQFGSIALSAAAHPLHVDGTFYHELPEWILLQVASSDDTGGVSTFYKISRLIADIPPHHLRTLMTEPVRYSREDHHGEDIYEGRILSYKGPGNFQLRWRYDDAVHPVPLAASAPIIQALEWVRDYLAHATPVSVSGQPGDIFVIRNREVLHGRTSLSPSSRRLVRRMWLQ